MNKKLYVGNLNYSLTEDELGKLFSEVGSVVSVNIITDRMSGQSKGFGFVEMDTEEAAQAAIERYNGYELRERQLKVSEARPPRERPRGGGDRQRGRGGYGREGDRDRRRRY